VFVKHGLLTVSFFCGNAMQSNRVKNVKKFMHGVCISFWIELWALFVLFVKKNFNYLYYDYFFFVPQICDVALIAKLWREIYHLMVTCL
jgi:hypothetical protein